MNRTERNKALYENQVFTSMDGREFIVTEYRKHDDVTIKFLNTTYERKTSMDHILSGKLKSPFYNNIKHAPFVFTDLQGEFLGVKYLVDGIVYEIIEVNSVKDIIYKCHDEFGYIGHTSAHSIRRHQFYNPYKRNVNGSYLGEDLTYRNKEYENVLRLWHGVIDRATGNIFGYNYKDPRAGKATKRSRVCKSWLCYGNFAAWYVPTVNMLNPNVNYDIDKDLLYPIYKQFTGIYKLYSPVTCELLPKELNIIIFDPAKERNENARAKIIKLAEYYKSINAISTSAYNAIQLIYNQKYDIQIPIDIYTYGYNEFAPRIDIYNDFY